MCFSKLRNIIFLEKAKKLIVTSLTASQQPLFAVPEHNTHPVLGNRPELGLMIILILKLLLESNGGL